MSDNNMSAGCRSAVSEGVVVGPAAPPELAAYEGDWGHLPGEPCIHCGHVGCVYFMIDDGPEGRKGLSPVRCDHCKRSWTAGEQS